MKVLRETTSGSDQVCSKCGTAIPAGESHFREALADRRLNFVGKRYCPECATRAEPKKGWFDP